MYSLIVAYMCNFLLIFIPYEEYFIEVMEILSCIIKDHFYFFLLQAICAYTCPFLHKADGLFQFIIWNLFNIIVILKLMPVI